MGIYLKGIDMPKADKNVAICITIWANGDVTTEFGKQVIGKAVSVPAHGRCIDADAFIKENEYFADRDFNNPRYDTTLRELVGTAPTIIPAEEGE